jgi:hypothetical protein
VDPLVFSLMRDIIAFPVLYGFALLFEGVRPIETMRDFIVLVLMGLFSLCFGQVCALLCSAILLRSSYFIFMALNSPVQM